MSEQTEAESWQQSQANVVPNLYATTTAQQRRAVRNAWGSGLRLSNAKKKGRGRPKNKTDGTQSDGPSPPRNTKQRQNDKKR